MCVLYSVSPCASVLCVMINNVRVFCGKFYTQIPRQYLVLPTLKASLLEIETHWGFRDDLILLRAGIHSPEQLTISI